MAQTDRRLPCIAAVLLALAACGGQPDRVIRGRVDSRGAGVVQASVEIYLTSGRDQGAAPFYRAATDDTGVFSLTLPRGRYYLVARGEAPGGVPLVGDFSGNPLDLTRGGPPGEVVILLEPALAAREYRGPADSGVAGRVTLGGNPAGGAFVYIYESDAGELMGPGFLAARAVDASGKFLINLSPGRYWVVARLKAGGGKVGFVGAGDATGAWDGNPVTVPAGRFVDLGAVVIRPADTARLARTERERRQPTGKAGVAGRVLGPDSRPYGGLNVMAYGQPQMIGRPLAMGTSAEDGSFALALPRGGRYFLGARANRSGPRRPGEMAGGYEGTPDHAVDVPDAGWVSGIDIPVEEVW